MKRLLHAAILLTGLAGAAGAANPIDGSPSPIYNDSRPQVATYNVSSGTVRGQLSVGALKLPDGTIVNGAEDLGGGTGEFKVSPSSGVLPGVLATNVIASSVAVNAVGNAQISGVAASKLTGALPAISGASLTGLTKGQVGLGSVPNTDATNASNLALGTIPDARFPSSLPAVSGALLTGLNASSLGSGTIPNGRFPATLPAASGVNLTALNAGNLASGTIPDGRFPATLPAASGANLTALSADALSSGTIPNARVDSSSVTKQGNAVNTANHLVKLDGSGNLPAAGGAALTALSPAALSSGALPATVIASSVAVNSVPDTAIVAVSASKLTGNLPATVQASSVAVAAVLDASIVSVSASKLTGMVANAAIDTSSVTKAGNTFNSASRLVKLDGSAALPAVNGAALTGLTTGQVGLTNVQNVDQTVASNLTSGTVANARIDSSSVTKQGNAFNGASQLVQMGADGYLPALDGRNLMNLPGGGGSGGGDGLGPHVATKTLNMAGYPITGLPAVASTGTLTMGTGVNTLTTAAGLLIPGKLATGLMPSDVIASSVAVNAVGTAQVADAAITTAKVLDDQITAVKMKQAATGLNAGWLNTTDGSGNFTSLQPLTTFYDLGRYRSADFAASTANTYDLSASTNPTYNRMKFDNSASSTTNCGYVEDIAPNDFNTTLDPRLNQFVVKNGTATDSANQRYVVRVASITFGTTTESRTYGASVNVDITSGGGATFANRGIGTPLTLTGWAARITPGMPYAIEVCRAGSDGTNDPSTVDSYMVGFQTRYAHTAPGN